MRRIYFDNAATTPLDPDVLAVMRPWLEGDYGNPSSMHEEGRRARVAIDEARTAVAALLNATSEQIVFTGSGTEADHLALTGVLPEGDLQGIHLITSAMEHPAILGCCRHLQRRGADWTTLPVSAAGLVDPEDLRTALRPQTRLVSIMAANNVVGTIQPLGELAAIVRRHGALFHTDAVQAVGKIPLNVRDVPIDLLSLSGHKLHGPKGTGALFVRSGVQLRPMLDGGGQEAGRRSGTENVAGLVGLGAAAHLAHAQMGAEAARLVRLRDRLLEGITHLTDSVYLVGDRYCRLPGHLCLGFAGLENDAIRLLLELDRLGIAVSSGSACSSHHAGQPSHVLEAMGFDPLRARGSLRLTLGRFNTAEDVDQFLRLLPKALANLRPLRGLGRAV